MPICCITISRQSGGKSIVMGKQNNIRDIVANGLDSNSRLLNRNHISIRINEDDRQFMLGDVELSIFAQFYLRRFFSRDKRANSISASVSKLLNVDCATWINLSFVGYSRVTTKGENIFASRAENKKIREQRKEAIGKLSDPELSGT